MPGDLPPGCTLRDCGQDDEPAPLGGGKENTTSALFRELEMEAREESEIEMERRLS